MFFLSQFLLHQNVRHVYVLKYEKSDTSARSKINHKCPTRYIFSECQTGIYFLVKYIKNVRQVVSVNFDGFLCVSFLCNSNVRQVLFSPLLVGMFKLVRRVPSYFFKTLICPTGSCLTFHDIKMSDRFFFVSGNFIMSDRCLLAIFTIKNVRQDTLGNF